MKHQSTSMPLESTTNSLHRYKLTVGLVLDDSLDRPDGVQQYVLTLGEWLRSRGHAVHYLTSTSIRRDKPNIHDLAANIGVNFNGNYMRTPLPASKREIKALLKEYNFDVVHVQMPYSPLLAGRVISAAASQSVIFGTFHIVPRSSLVAIANKVLGRWSRKTLAKFDAIYSVSPAAQAFAKSAYNLPSGIIANPIDLEIFASAKPFSRPTGAPCNILFLGRLVPRKGCMLLLQAALLLRQDTTTKPFTVTICGKGPLWHQLRQFVRANHLQDIVEFKGFIAESEKPRYYASADITVFPSSGGESFGIVLAEAMASGNAAVIAGDNAGYRSVLEDCPSDVLFDPRNADDLAQLIKYLMADNALRKHIAAWQCRHARRYDIERIGNQVYKAYLVALQRKHNMR